MYSSTHKYNKMHKSSPDSLHIIFPVRTHISELQNCLGVAVSTWLQYALLDLVNKVLGKWISNPLVYSILHDTTTIIVTPPAPNTNQDKTFKTLKHLLTTKLNNLVYQHDT